MPYFMDENIALSSMYCAPASRYLLPVHVWQITHRCHQNDFLLKFSKNHQCWQIHKDWVEDKLMSTNMT